MRYKLKKAKRFVADHGARTFLVFALQRTLGPYSIRVFGSVIGQRLRKWLDQNPKSKPPFIMLSTLDWKYPYRQRPQHLANALARLGHSVIYVTPSTGHDRVLTTEQVAENIILIPSIDAALSVVDRPVLVVLSTDTRWTKAHLDKVRAKGGVIVYDYLDALDDSLSHSAITAERRDLHAHLLSDEDRTVVVSVADVLDHEVARSRSTHHALVTNGVDVEPFLLARRDRNIRSDLAAVVHRNQPIIGYYGSLAAWFDYALLLKLARARPNYQIVTIGPDLDGSSVAFSNKPDNLHVLMGMDYDDLPRHGCWFDVCLVPFVINEITMATSPLKIFEYMAMCSPIVSTPLPECRKYASILIGENHNDFVDKVDLALGRRFEPDLKATLLREARQNSWTEKASQLEERVRNLIEEKHR